MRVTLSEVKIEDGQKAGKDILRITKGRIQANCQVVRFVDKDTSQIVLLIPSMGLSGYGETKDKAKEMAKEALVDYLTYLASLSHKKQKQILTELGWKNEWLSNKEFSNAFVDIDGQLKGFNASNVEHLTLEAA